MKRFMALAWLAALAMAAGCSSTGSSMPPAYRYPPRGTPASATRPAAAAPAAAPRAAVAQPAPAAAAPAARVSAAARANATTAAYRLKPSDPVIITLRGIPNVPEQQIEVQVDENGMINLPYINQVTAGGKTATEVEQAVQTAYVEQQIYKYITVNVVIPSRSYFVRGEVRTPGRFALISRVTIVQAIAAAGGFTEFANQSKVEVLRGTDKIRVNVRDLEEHPERDREIEAGDVIIVYRSVF